MTIEPYIHRCVVASGPMSGNKVATSVTWWDAESNTICDYCKEPLATIDDLVGHMYRELTNKEDLI